MPSTSPSVSFIPQNMTAWFLIFSGCFLRSYNFISPLTSFISGTPFCSVLIAILTASSQPGAGLSTGIPRSGSRAHQSQAASDPSNLLHTGALPSLLIGSDWKSPQVPTVFLRLVCGAHPWRPADYLGFLLLLSLSFAFSHTDTKSLMSVGDFSPPARIFEIARKPRFLVLLPILSMGFGLIV